MTTSTTNISAILSDFTKEIDSLIAFDAHNQSSLSSGISLQQLEMLTESTFFKAFRTFENFIRDIFMLYCMEEYPASGSVVESFLKAQDTLHAEQMIQSSMPFLEWNSPDIVIKRAELYLKDGFPVKIPYAASRIILDEMRLLRNHIAHNSQTSLQGYHKVVKNHNGGVLPIPVPIPGAFLLMPTSASIRQYNLIVYFKSLKTIAANLT